MRAWLMVVSASLALAAMLVWAQPPVSDPPEPTTRPLRRAGSQPPPRSPDGFPRPTSRPARPGRMSETEMANLLGWLQVHQTAIYNHAIELQKGDEQAYRSFLHGIGRLKAEIEEMPPELQRRSWRIREDNVRIAELLKQYRAASGPARPAMVSQLREILTRQFEDTQKLREYQLELLVKHIEEIRGQIQQRLEHQDSLIDQRLEDILADRDDLEPTSRPAERGRRD